MLHYKLTDVPGSQHINFLVQPEELFNSLADTSLRIIDASWHLEASRCARNDFDTAHLPGAVFFDLDAVSDPDTSLPHMLPSPGVFQAAVGKLGISRHDRIVIYDSTGVFSAPRVWWTFRIMGAQHVQLLDGGLASLA